MSAAAHGAGGLRASVCCAGIGWAERVARSRGPHGLEAFERVLAINVIGTFNVLRQAAHAMLANQPDADGERGVCINTASIAAYDGQIGQIAYAASKGAIVGMTLPAARDLADGGVRVCTIAPGTFDTPLLSALPAPAREALAEGVPFPRRLGTPRGIRFAGRPHHRQRDAQRRGHPARRRAAHATPLISGVSTGVQARQRTQVTAPGLRLKRHMRKTSLIATALTLVLAGAPVASATARLPDPIAHAATPRDSPYPRPFGTAATSTTSTRSATGTVTGTDGTPAHAHAYGKACATESHQHVAGTSRHPVLGVRARAQDDRRGTSHNAAGACTVEPRKHVKGEKGTSFSRCVAAARKVAHAKAHTQATRRTTTGPR